MILDIHILMHICDTNEECLINNINEIKSKIKWNIIMYIHYNISKVAINAT